MQLCSTWAPLYKHTHTHTHTHIWPLGAPTFTLSDVQTNTNKRMKRQAVMYACTETYTHAHSELVTWALMCAILWMTGLILGHRVHLHIFTFSHSISTLNFFFLPPYKFSDAECARVCICVRTHPTGECVCHSVLLQGREGEACLFQGTPPELMFHTCAQCSTLYRASQVHCINCGRNHFIVGVLLLLFSGMHSITQYSHLNCF